MKPRLQTSLGQQLVMTPQLRQAIRLLQMSTAELEIELTEAVETTTAAGRMMMQMVGAYAEFERAMLRERTRNGLLAARQEGRIGGRRPKLTARQQQEVVRLVGSGEQTAADAARLFNVHPSTIARLLAKARLGSQA